MLIDQFQIDSNVAAELVRYQARSVVGWWPRTVEVIQYDFSRFFSEIWSMPPTTHTHVSLQPIPMTIEIPTGKSHVGLHNHIRVDNIRSWDDWMTSGLNRPANVRHRTFYYPEIMEHHA